jgi:hypothetical protein
MNSQFQTDCSAMGDAQPEPMAAHSREPPAQCLFDDAREGCRADRGTDALDIN